MLNNTLLNLTQRLAKVGGWSSTTEPNAEVYWTPSTYEIFDFEGSSAPSFEQVLECALPQYHQLILHSLQQVREGIPSTNEVEILTFKGNHKWVRIIAESDIDDSGKVTRMSGAVLDITEEKLREHTQRVLSERLFTTFECMTDAFYMLDNDWRLIYINETATNMIGRGVNKGLGKSLWSLFPELENTPMYIGFHQSIVNEEPFHLEYYSKLMENWIELDAYPSSEGLAVFFHSISEQKVLNDRIIASEQRLKYVAQATLDSAWDWDLENNKVWWSGGLDSLFARDVKSETQEMITDSQFWIEQIHPDDRMRVINNLENLIKSGMLSWEENYQLLRENGEYSHVEHRAFIVRGDDGEAINVVGGIKDVSARIDMENRMLRSQRLESVGKLTGHVAHDFNNLLTVILGNAELLLGHLESNPKLKEMASTICKAALKGSDLTARLLAFARRQTLEPRSIDMNQMVSNMHPLLERTLGVDIEIQYFAEENIPAALADANQLEGALLNLCLNSRDAMPDGGKLIIETSVAEIDNDFSHLYNELKSGTYVVLSVTDSGSGIPPELVKLVFEPFFTTKAAGKGTGLGLSSVFGFVKQSNGNISIYSEPGAGTTVKIYLPVSLEEATSLRVKDQSVEGGRETILVVDDDELVRAVAESLLSISLGYKVHVMADAVSALELLKSGEKIDLVFTDVMMPGMNGKEFARKVRASWPDMKILFTSGFTENSIVHDGKLDEGFNLLPKPYPLIELAKKVREVLDE